MKNERWLYVPAMTIAVLSAIVVALCPFVPAVRTSLVKPAIYIAAAVGSVLFLRMLFDPKCRRGMFAAKTEMFDGGPWYRRSFFDPEWGLFGSRLGSPTLLKLRAVVLAELVLAVVLNRHGPPDVAMLAFAALMIVQLLGVIQLGLTTPLSDT